MMDQIFNSLGNTLLYGFGISVVFFIVFRFVLLWYFKIDKIVGLLEKIEKNTRKNVEVLSVGENNPPESSIIASKKLGE